MNLSEEALHIIKKYSVSGGYFVVGSTKNLKSVGETLKTQSSCSGIYMNDLVSNASDSMTTFRKSHYSIQFQHAKYEIHLNVDFQSATPFGNRSSNCAKLPKIYRRAKCNRISAALCGVGKRNHRICFRLPFITFLNLITNQLTKFSNIFLMMRLHIYYPFI